MFRLYFDFIFQASFSEYQTEGSYLNRTNPSEVISIEHALARAYKALKESEVI